MAVHQLIPSFLPGDAMGQAALHCQVLLRRLGHWGELYAGERDARLSALARPASELRPKPDDWVLYHHGIASPLAGDLLHLPCRRGVIFHNITPARFYEGTRLADALVAGRAQLAAMPPHVELAIGVSRFNAAELEEAGFAKAHVVPLFVEPQRFAAEATPAASLRVLSVSRLVPHKRVEDLLALHAELLRLDARATLALVGPYDEGSAYFRSLARRAKRLGRVEFLGRVSHARLAAEYRRATAYVSMSEHEGFGLPLVEAMAADVPVLAYAAAAVPETLGGAGIAFDEKQFAFLAELVRELGRDKALRRRVVAGQRKRLSAFSSEAATRSLAKALPAPAPTQPSRGRKPRVAVVVQRYGPATGGAEAHARALAHRLAPHYDVTVLTSCAKSHLSWANELKPGTSRDGPVRVRRFSAERTREMSEFNRLSRAVFGKSNDRLHEEQWIAEQGPLLPGLFEHVAERRYDGYIWFTYLYAPTAWGLPLVADRSVLVPTAHDEAPMHFGAYAEAFERPRAIFCNTPEEQALIQARFPKAAPSRVVGVGVEEVRGEPQRFRRRFDQERPYLLYVGRIEAGKDIPELLRCYRAYRAGREDAPDLLLAGAQHMRVREAGVRLLGQISDEDKWDGLAGAAVVVVPSRFESLSLLALEAMAQGTPIVVNGRSDVLAGQVKRSGAGAAYSDAASFAKAVDAALAKRARWGKRGRAYARRHRWQDVVEVYRAEINTMNIQH